MNEIREAKKVVIELNTLIHLAPWCEVIGTYGGLYEDDDYLYVKVRGEIVQFAKDSRAAEIARNTLKGLMGRKVGILRTDEPAKPILIRIIKEQHKKKP